MEISKELMDKFLNKVLGNRKEKSADVIFVKAVDLGDNGDIVCTGPMVTLTTFGKVTFSLFGTYRVPMANIQEVIELSKTDCDGIISKAFDTIEMVFSVFGENQENDNNN